MLRWLGLGVALVMVVGCEPEDPLEVVTSSDTGSVDTRSEADTRLPDTAEEDSGSALDTAPGDVGDPDVLRPRFELGASDFYRAPWPSDVRVEADGTVDLSDFPSAGQATVRKYRSAVEDLVGFSTMPVIYIEMAGPMGDVSLPTAAETLTVESPIQLLEVGPGGCGERVPLDLLYQEKGDKMRRDRVLSATPVPGFVLKPRTTYGFVVRANLGAAAGLEAERPAGFEAALSEGGAWAESLTPLWTCPGMVREEVLVATVFTTQDPTSEVRAVRDFVVDPAKTSAPTLSSFVDAGKQGTVAGVLKTFEGRYDTPIFQAGETPYQETGGGFVWDGETGEPVVQRWESVRFTVSVPAKGTGPFPVLIWMDGTGSELYDYVTRDTIAQLANRGFVVASFQPQMHGERSGPNADADLHSFNFINPEAGRTVFRQQIVDTAYFIRVLREAVSARTEVQLDLSRIVYGGHSQGAIVGAMVAGIETELEAYVLNGVGSYISETIILRKDPEDIAALIQLLLGLSGPLSVHHPAVQLAQLAADTVDPHNYAAYWRGFPGREQGVSVMMINGASDHTTFPRSMNALTIAGGLDVVEPAGWEVDPDEVWEGGTAPLPLSGNQQGLNGNAVTMGSYFNAATGHHTLREDGAVRAGAVGFWVSGEAGLAVIPVF